MPLKKVFEGKTEYLQILDQEGKIDKTLDPKLKTDLLKKIFETMVFARMFDDKAVKLQRQGRMGTYAPLLGQEAVGTAAGLALGKDDWALPTYREPQIYYIRGVPLEKLYMYWRGNEEGMNFPKDANVFPFAVPIGTHLTQAVGMAFALKRAGKKQVILTCVGDGGSSEGDFHEALNFAGVWQVPIVFLVINNGWAISLPRSEQSASKTLAQKALGYGFSGMQVDGNDALAVYSAVSDAIERARKGLGPQLVEALTYRMSMHTTSDDPTRYRTEKEVAEWKKKDPIDRFRKYLQKKKIWTKSYEDKIVKQFAQEIEEAVQKAEANNTDPRDMFRFVWAETTQDLKEQMAEMEKAYLAEAMK